jgi:hypothetical protein
MNLSEPECTNIINTKTLLTLLAFSVYYDVISDEVGMQ